MGLVAAKVKTTAPRDRTGIWPDYLWMTTRPVPRSRAGFAATLRELASRGYSRRTLYRHYLAAAVKNEKRFFKDRVEVRIKQYFYSLRPLCALRWIASRHDLPPMELDSLMDGIDVPGDVAAAIADLKAWKVTIGERALGPRRPVLDAWIADELARAAEREPPDTRDPAMFREEADDLFRALVLA